MARILQWINAVHFCLKTAPGQETSIPNLERQLVGKSTSQPDPLTSPLPFLFQYDYLGDRRPVPAGLFPYNYPPSPTVHDKMVRPLLPSHFPSGPLPSQGAVRLGQTDAGGLCAQCLVWVLAASGYLLPPGLASTPGQCSVPVPPTLLRDTGQRSRDEICKHEMPTSPGPQNNPPLQHGEGPGQGALG